MPSVMITMLRGRDGAARRAVMDAVHAALVEAFGIPQDDRMQRVFELSREDFDIPPRCSEAFVMVEIAAFAGRSVDAKRALYRAMVRELGQRCGVPPEDVFVMVEDRPMENWGLRGGQAGCDIDFGFKIDV